MKNKDTKFHQEILLDNQIKKKKGNKVCQIIIICL